MKRLLLLVAASAFAQTPATVPSLIEYLDLTATQITRLRQNAGELSRFQEEKAVRFAQVERELAEENAREVVDPLALGLRHVELEAICREMRTAYEANFTKNQTVLTDAQKTKLRALDAMAVTARLASAASSENLLDAATGGFGRTALVGIPGGISFAQYVLGGANFGVGQFGSVCGVPVVSSRPILLNAEKKQEVAK